jgi:hypothetical protein
MKVKELIEALEILDGDIEVFVYDTRSGCGDRADGCSIIKIFHKDEFSGGDICDALAEGDEYIELYIG